MFHNWLVFPAKGPTSSCKINVIRFQLLKIHLFNTQISFIKSQNTELQPHKAETLRQQEMFNEGRFTPQAKQLPLLHLSSSFESDHSHIQRETGGGSTWCPRKPATDDLTLSFSRTLAAFRRMRCCCCCTEVQCRNLERSCKSGPALNAVS